MAVNNMGIQTPMVCDNFFTEHQTISFKFGKCKTKKKSIFTILLYQFTGFLISEGKRFFPCFTRSLQVFFIKLY